MAFGTDVSRVVVVGGGIAGLAAALRLERLYPGTEVVLVESRPRLGGTILTEEVSGFLVEGGPDSFLARKPRGIGLCKELGLTCDLIERVARNCRTYVRLGGELRPLPAGLTGMIPTRLDALASSGILSPEGLARFACESELPAGPEAGDESIAAFVTRRLGREAYERLVEPLMSGIYAGDGEQLSLAATFPNLRQLEREYGSVTRGLLAGSSESAAAGPPFLSLRGGMRDLVAGLAERLVDTTVVTGRTVASVRRAAHGHGYELELADGETLSAGAVVLATPAYVTGALVASLDPQLADAHAEIPYASTAIVTLAYPAAVLSRPLDGYGYVVPRVEDSDVLACTWTSSKWPGRAPEAHALVRVYLGRYGRRDVTVDSDEELVASARGEIAATLAPSANPVVARVHRWPRGMPQYVMGSLERLAVIERRLAEHPGLAVAGAAYRGVGIPDCIASGEQAAEKVLAGEHALERAS
jgi:oxygen-dependent protoporphyrinogen oxidase